MARPPNWGTIVSPTRHYHSKYFYRGVVQSGCTDRDRVCQDPGDRYQVAIESKLPAAIFIALDALPRDLLRRLLLSSIAIDMYLFRFYIISVF